MFKGDLDLSKIGEDEPVFLLRAQDLIAPHVVHGWVVAAEIAKVAEAKVEDAKKCSDAMLEWQGMHPYKVKRPD